jgi:hypothetical protein
MNKTPKKIRSRSPPERLLIYDNHNYLAQPPLPDKIIASIFESGGIILLRIYWFFWTSAQYYRHKDDS